MNTRPRIAVVGSINIDYVASVPELPVPGETVSGGTIEVVPGGKGANQAAAAARLGGDVAMVSAVGDDAAAGIALASLASAGVSTTRSLRTLPVSSCETGNHSGSRSASTAARACASTSVIASSKRISSS